MTLTEQLKELLEQLKRDVEGDLKQANMTLNNDYQDNIFLSSRGTLLNEIENTLELNLATFKQIKENK